MGDFNQKWQELLKTSGMRPMLWGVTGGNEWTSYKQFDENEYRVQIFTHENFDEYKRRKGIIVSFFDQIGFQLADEYSAKEIAFGYWKELRFFSEEKIKEIKKREQVMLNPNIGSIYAPGGVVNFGTISSSPISIDNSVHEIEKRIEELGGDDKEALYQFLYETKAMLEDCSAKKQIAPKPGFFAQLNTHVVKHGWFYGAILQLVGTAALGIIG